MKLLKRLLIAIAIIVGLVLAFAAFLPSSKHIEDSITIKAPADLIFRKVNSLKSWEQWSPFQKGDPEMTSEYEGPDSGVGAIQKWKSPKNGDGRMEIISSNPSDSVKMKLEMMEGQSVFSDWTFVKEGDAVKVTWSVDVAGMGYPLGRIMGLFMPAMMHDAFRKGLEELKNICEAEAKEMMVYKTSEVLILDMDPWNGLVIKDSAGCDKVGEVLGAIYGELQGYLKTNRIEPSGAPFARYHLWDDKANKFVVEAGFPVDQKTKAEGRMYLIEFPKIKAVSASHFGSYETSNYTYEAIEKYISDHKLVQKGFPWEVYVNDAATEPDMKKWETRIYYPVE